MKKVEISYMIGFQYYRLQNINMYLYRIQLQEIKTTA